MAHTQKLPRGKEFEQLVADLLKLKGYEVSHNEIISGTQIDVVAKIRDRFANVTLLVECNDRAEPTGIDLVKTRAAVLLDLHDPTTLHRLLFVSRVGFTAEAKAYARERANVMLLTALELEHSIIDFGPYVSWYLKNYETSEDIFREGELFNAYIELSARRHVYLAEAESLSTLTRNWLQGDSRILFLLGEYGSGKTSFCRHLVYELLRERSANASQDPLPLLLNLRDCRQGFRLTQLVTDTLVNNYGCALPSFMAFKRVCSSRIVGASL